jgi:hypothetical protein
VGLVLVVTIAPWVIRNTVRFDLVAMSNQGGRALFHRVFDRTGLPVPVDAEYGGLARAVQVNPRAELPPPAPVVPWFYSNFHYVLVHNRGLSDEDAGSVEQRLALVAIRRHPWAYASDSWRRLGTALERIRHFSGSSELRRELQFTRPPLGAGLTPTLWHVGRLLTNVWWLVSLHALAALLLLFVGGRVSRYATASFLSVWLVVSLGTVLGEGGVWRYSIQLAPVTWILGSAGAVLVVSSVRRSVASRRSAALA